MRIRDGSSDVCSSDLIVAAGDVVRAIPAPATAEKSRKFFDDMNSWAQGEGFAGLGYATRKGGEWGGPIAKNHGPDKMDALAAELGLGPDDGLFFAAGKEAVAARLSGLARTRVAGQRDLIDAYISEEDTSAIQPLLTISAASFSLKT